MLGTVARDHVAQLADRLAAGDAAELLRFARSLEQWAPDYAQLLDELASLLTRVALKQVVSDYEGDELYAGELIERLAGALGTEDVQLYYQTAIIGRRDLPIAPDPRTGFEMTLLRMIAFRPHVDGAPVAQPRAFAQPGAEMPTEGATEAGASDASPAGTVVPSGEWAAVLAQLDLQGAARQLANHCVLVGREGARVRLALDPRSRSLRTASLEEKLVQALSRHFGEAVRVEFVSAPASGETPAQSRQRTERERADAARRDFETDPGVRGFREHFGAEVLPETVRPLK